MYYLCGPRVSFELGNIFIEVDAFTDSTTTNGVGSCLSHLRARSSNGLMEIMSAYFDSYNSTLADSLAENRVLPIGIA